MQVRAGDRMITALVNERQVGEHFAKWLLHVTVVPWFRTERSTAELTSALERQLAQTPPFTARMGGEAQLDIGDQRTALVNLVVRPTPFDEIQPNVMAVLDDGHTDFVSKDTWGRAYLPHVTAKPKGRVYSGDKFPCNQLYIVAKDQPGGHHIDGIVRLGHEAAA